MLGPPPGAGEVSAGRVHGPPGAEETDGGQGGWSLWSLTRMSLLHFSNFLNIHPITMAYNLKSTTQAHLTSLGRCPANPRGRQGGEVAPGEGGGGGGCYLVLQLCSLKKRQQPELFQQ